MCLRLRELSDYIRSFLSFIFAHSTAEDKLPNRGIDSVFVFVKSVYETPLQMM